MRATMTAALLLAMVLAFGGTASAQGKTWKDEKTGLTWQVTPTGERFKWEQAKAHCSGLSLDGGGWRLPTKEELASLIRGCKDDGCKSFKGPANGCYWPDEIKGKCKAYWSSSAKGPKGAWFVTFARGDVGSNGVNYDDRVRCVR